MKKRFFVFLLLSVLCLALSASAFAYGDAVIDGGGKLSYAEAQSLRESVREFAEEYDFQIVFVTVAGESISDYVSYADDMYDTGGYLTDGILLLVDTDERVWYVSTAGRGIDAFSDNVIDLVMDSVLDYLAQDDYYSAFSEFVYGCKNHLQSYDSGEYSPTEEDYYDYSEHSGSVSGHGVSTLWIFISIGIGLVTALIAMSVMKSGMHSVKPQKTASNYAKRGSLILTEKQDIFLYHTVSRVAKPKDNDGNSGGSFGGGVHMSGGGISHGGHGGRF